MDEADKLCDRVGIIDYGQIKVVGEPNELKSQIGGDIITLKFKNETNSYANQALEEIKKLSSIENIAPTKESYNVVAKDGETTIPKIFEVANKEGVMIESISLKRPSLDDVFMAYTGRELREETGSKEDLMKERIRMRRARK
jgi:ABC-2 type transport system ATP-binding protein